MCTPPQVSSCYGELRTCSDLVVAIAKVVNPLHHQSHNATVLIAWLELNTHTPKRFEILDISFNAVNNPM